ncbi:APC family permease [Salinimicrobium terrae]|uniref:APC family permease n=1 Tax=Salinimicrobium terrae TaxID=470866 RepID=UPI0004012747|nr:APC family permease [Salinimicrobium terrae]
MGKKELKRSLGFWDVLMFGVGGVVGAGIYAIIGQAAGLSGNMLWVSFVIAATVALLTGLSYAEFVSRYPDSGGSFEYMKQGLGKKTAYGMSIFIVFTGIVAAAAIAISFADYLSRLIDLPNYIIVIGIILLMGFFNIIGAKYSSYYNGFATIVILIGLAAVVVVSIPEFGTTPLFETNDDGWTGLFAGGALIFFSYIGFEDLVKMAEETKNPKVNMPKAVIMSGIIVLIIYVLIAISAVSVLDWKQLSNSNGPLAAVIEAKLGAWGATSLVFIALFATSKTILSNILGTSRLLYDVARDSNKAWLKKFTTISGIGNAPNYAIIAISLVAIGFGLIGKLQVVASISNIFIFIVFGMVNVALLNLRHKKRNEENEKPPFYIRLNANNIPLPTVLALITILILFGFNIYNLFQGNL